MFSSPISFLVKTLKIIIILQKVHKRNERKSHITLQLQQNNFHHCEVSPCSLYLIFIYFQQCTGNFVSQASLTVILFRGCLTLCNMYFMGPPHLSAKSSPECAWILLQGMGSSLVFPPGQLSHVLFNYSSPLLETTTFSGKLSL